jgi:hypothetical protein
LLSLICRRALARGRWGRLLLAGDCIVAVRWPHARIRGVDLFDVEGGDARFDASLSHGDRDVPRFGGEYANRAWLGRELGGSVAGAERKERATTAAEERQKRPTVSHHAPCKAVESTGNRIR